MEVLRHLQTSTLCIAQSGFYRLLRSTTALFTVCYGIGQDAPETLPV